MLNPLLKSYLPRTLNPLEIVLIIIQNTAWKHEVHNVSKHFQNILTVVNMHLSQYEQPA